MEMVHLHVRQPLNVVVVDNVHKRHAKLNRISPMFATVRPVQRIRTAKVELAFVFLRVRGAWNRAVHKNAAQRDIIVPHYRHNLVLNQCVYHAKWYALLSLAHETKTAARVSVANMAHANQNDQHVLKHFVSHVPKIQSVVQVICA